MNTVQSRSALAFPRARVSLIGIVALVILAAVAFAFVTSSSSHQAGAALKPQSALPAGTVLTLDIPGIGGGPAIPGDGSVANHPSTSIEVNAFSWGASNSVADAKGSGGGKVSFQPFSVTKKIDISSPNLFQVCASNQNLGTVYLYLDVPGQSGSTGVANYTTYGTYTLTNAHVASCSESANDGDESPSESISFAFQKITFDYNSGSSTNVHFGWNVLTNKAA
jgi:type VI secretion system secreted protein Hcp